MAVDLHRHQKTPFAEMTEKHEPIIFLAGDMVRGARTWSAARSFTTPNSGGSAKSIGRRRTSGRATRALSPLAAVLSCLSVRGRIKKSDGRTADSPSAAAFVAY